MDSNEPEDSEPSHSVKSTSGAAQSCATTGPKSQSSMMCEPSPESSATLSAGASHARTSALPASEQGSPESDPGCGVNMLGSLASYDRATSLWRTSQHSLFGGLDEFSETWPRSGMTRSGTAYQLPPLVRLTAETESGSWPTPDVRGFTNDGSLMMLSKKTADREEWSQMAYRKGRSSKERLWPTPQAQMPGATPNSPKVKNLLTGSRHSFYLTQAVEAERIKPGVITKWPTPTSRDYKDGSAESCKNVPANGLLGRVVHQFQTPTVSPSRGLRIKQEDGSDVRQRLEPPGGSLNPTWVEWLMGFPLGWTVLKSSATQSSPTSRKSSGARSSKRKD